MTEFDKQMEEAFDYVKSAMPFGLSEWTTEEAFTEGFEHGEKQGRLNDAVAKWENFKDIEPPLNKRVLFAFIETRLPTPKWCLVTGACRYSDHTPIALYRAHILEDNIDTLHWMELPKPPMGGAIQ